MVGRSERDIFVCEIVRIVRVLLNSKWSMWNICKKLVGVASLDEKMVVQN